MCCERTSDGWVESLSYGVFHTSRALADILEKRRKRFSSTLEDVEQRTPQFSGTAEIYTQSGSEPVHCQPPSAETDPLIETAKKLEISNGGKKKAQISDEIVAKSKASGTTAWRFLLKNMVERELAIGLSLSQGIESEQSSEGGLRVRRNKRTPPCPFGITLTN
jgi:hypothetical protein